MPTVSTVGLLEYEVYIGLYITVFGGTLLKFRSLTHGPLLPPFCYRCNGKFTTAVSFVPIPLFCAVTCRLLVCGAHPVQLTVSAM